MRKRISGNRGEQERVMGDYDKRYWVCTKCHKETYYI